MGFQWIFAILAPSGKGLPLPGTPALNASIIVGFPTITANNPPLRLTAMTCQPSYPLNSENASPFGTFNSYLSCADNAAPVLKTASAAAIHAMVSLLLFLITATPMIELMELAGRNHAPVRSARAIKL